MNLLVLSSHSTSYVSVNRADSIRTNFAIAASSRAGPGVHYDCAWRSSGVHDADAAANGPTIGFKQTIVHRWLWSIPRGEVAHGMCNSPSPKDNYCNKTS
jgi:hypothetical protein